MSETITPTNDSSANLPGIILKRCREYHDISLEEASETTKIGISYLKSLEEDQINGFANLAYLKGFLRIYSSYLGLNPDDMARMYDKLYGAKDVKKDFESVSSKSGRAARSLATLQKLALPAVFLFLILITVTLFKRQPEPTIRPSQPAAAPSPIIPVADVQPPLRTTEQIKSPPQEIEVPKTEINTAVMTGPDKPLQPKTAADPKGFVIKIKVTQNGSLNVSVDGSGAQSYEVTAGDIIEWKAEKSVALELSNAGGVDVELNGKSFNQLGPAGKPAYVVFDADGIRP